jgi:hypothetical protein
MRYTLLDGLDVFLLNKVVKTLVDLLFVFKPDCFGIGALFRPLLQSTYLVVAVEWVCVLVLVQKFFKFFLYGVAHILVLNPPSLILRKRLKILYV